MMATFQVSKEYNKQGDPARVPLFDDVSDIDWLPTGSRVGYCVFGA